VLYIEGIHMNPAAKEGKKKNSKFSISHHKAMYIEELFVRRRKEQQKKAIQ
jgi:hypothetical protein